ncbi:DUF3579 domain-containing protein [Denitratisoma oestradiolicum]|uniref:DUF3579 domain-containing protein n=1 Tax=Denitratisoma oestradiolicum TaxID=311182 RepID=A0A6S6XUX0_9PROT|nr:DUF3579 domain-containing protein [Denitratisoma oestradiolicum]TWO80011.1 hypothetical protein CBW56_11875 [Denitratisoma oestradiolicum]CAB1369777.1 conserved protein of unknown function [Denitratisoma oestradiolicum]
MTTTQSRHESFIIVGVTHEGRRFRPSDWAERLCGTMSVFGAERRMAYSPYVQPGNHEGEKCVFVDIRIHDIETKAYHFLERFAQDNNLKVIAPWVPPR